MSCATREAFLKPIELESVVFECRLGKVTMQEQSGSAMSELNDWVNPDGQRDPNRAKRLVVRLITMSIVGEDGQRLLTEDDMDLIESYPKKLQQALADNACRINGLLAEGDEVEIDLRGKSSS